jgi:hypothetical protein
MSIDVWYHLASHTVLLYFLLLVLEHDSARTVALGLIVVVVVVVVVLVHLVRLNVPA